MPHLLDVPRFPSPDFAPPCSVLLPTAEPNVPILLHCLPCQNACPVYCLQFRARAWIQHEQSLLESCPHPDDLCMPVIGLVCARTLAFQHAAAWSLPTSGRLRDARVHHASGQTNTNEAKRKSQNRQFSPTQLPFSCMAANVLLFLNLEAAIPQSLGPGYRIRLSGRPEIIIHRHQEKQEYLFLSTLFEKNADRHGCVLQQV